MADVTDDRGQMLLVTGLVVAVALVALTLVLNSAIYAGNVAVREAGGDADEALEFEHVAVDGVGGVLERANAAGHPDHAAVEAAVRDGVARYGRLLARTYAEGGRTGELDVTGTAPGALLRQTNATRELASGDGAGAVANWTLAANVTQTRAATLDLNRTGLRTTTDPTGAFAVRLDGETADWTAYVYEDAGTGNVTVAVDNASAGPTAVCSVNAPNATVDLTAGTLAGRPCPGLHWAEDVTEYDVTFRRGDRAVGGYALTVNTAGASEVNATAFAGDGPAALPAVYSVTFDAFYETARVRYEETVRVAPGEPT